MNIDSSGATTAKEETDSEESDTDATISHAESKAKNKIADDTLAPTVSPRKSNRVIKSLWGFQDEL